MVALKSKPHTGRPGGAGETQGFSSGPESCGSTRAWPLSFLRVAAHESIRRLKAVAPVSQLRDAVVIVLGVKLPAAIEDSTYEAVVGLASEDACETRRFDFKVALNVPGKRRSAPVDRQGGQLNQFAARFVRFSHHLRSRTFRCYSHGSCRFPKPSAQPQFLAGVPSLLNGVRAGRTVGGGRHPRRDRCPAMRTCGRCSQAPGAALSQANGSIRRQQER